jgi:serine/threonine protein kinase
MKTKPVVQIMNNPVPIPPEGSFSDELRDFCSLCLNKHPSKRATAMQLLSHPWIVKNYSSPVDMAAFISSTVDPHTLIDEISFFFIHQYYRMLSMLLTCEPREAAMAAECLKGLYNEASVHSMIVDAASHSSTALPRRPRGKTGIAAKILETIALFKAWGVQQFDIKTVDCSVVQGWEGAVVLMAHGEMAGDCITRKFSDMFLLNSTVGRDGEKCFTISNQAFALL